ncbi:MAG: hypothetical protein IPG55_03455 [Saprospiraceae bacterium]|nr:hypothetical protein [Candidatus Defluviibacterium haderslevense]MBK7244690.1 hypothetical protein [Candidatus Defluviibacterium haderslevense]
MEFEVKTLKKEGRPSFEYSTLLKIYLFGYLNGLIHNPEHIDPPNPEQGDPSNPEQSNPALL